MKDKREQLRDEYRGKLLNEQTEHFAEPLEGSPGDRSFYPANRYEVIILMKNDDIGFCGSYVRFLSEDGSVHDYAYFAQSGINSVSNLTELGHMQSWVFSELEKTREGAQKYIRESIERARTRAEWQTPTHQRFADLVIAHIDETEGEVQ